MKRTGSTYNEIEDSIVAVELKSQDQIDQSKVPAQF